MEHFFLTGHHDSSNVSELMKLYKLKAIDRYSAGMSGSKGRKQVTSKNKQMMVNYVITIMYIIIEEFIIGNNWRNDL